MAIQISRSDVPYDRIVDYPVSERFLKLPIDPYLGLLGVSPLPSQKAIINAINYSKYRFITAAISRRQGKTYIANIIGQLVSLVPNCHILIMAPNYQLSQISFDLQRHLIKQFDLEVTKDNAKDKVIELSNGSSVRIGSVHQVDSCVGRSYDLIIFDEAALTHGMEAFNVALRPTLDKPNSKAMFISTPRGKNNWFSELFDRGFSDQFPQWVSIRATHEDNPRMSAEDVEEARRSMSEAEFKQEYEADFNMFEGQIWKFDRAECVEDLSQSEELNDLEFFAGIDVGFRDPTALVVVGYNYNTEKYYIVDEYYDAERTTREHAEEVQKLIEKWGLDYIYIDAAAQQTRVDFAAEYDIPTINAKKSVLDGIGHVSNLAETNRLIVDQNCDHVLYALDQYQWDTNPNLLKEKPKHNEASHMADALRYALYSYVADTAGF